MTKKTYNEILEKIMQEINSTIALMTIEEEYIYRKTLIEDLEEWTEEFRTMNGLEKTFTRFEDII
jgi:hypothetical protein